MRRAIENPFPRRLRARREIVGLSQAELGIRSGMDPGVSSARINQYERGRHAPKFETATKIAQVLGVPVAYLYCGDDALAEWILAFRPGRR